VPRATARPKTQTKPVPRRAATPRITARPPARQGARERRPTAPSLAPITAAVPRHVAPEPSRRTLVQWLVAGALLALLLGAASAGRRLVRHRPRPQLPPDRRSRDIEAELQEIIAEERARRYAETTRPQ
jgi:hypothetical protein